MRLYVSLHRMCIKGEMLHRLKKKKHSHVRYRKKSNQRKRSSHVRYGE